MAARGQFAVGQPFDLPSQHVIDGQAHHARLRQTEIDPGGRVERIGIVLFQIRYRREYRIFLNTGGGCRYQQGQPVDVDRSAHSQRLSCRLRIVISCSGGGQGITVRRHIFKAVDAILCGHSAGDTLLFNHQGNQGVFNRCPGTIHHLAGDLIGAIRLRTQADIDTGHFLALDHLDHLSLFPGADVVVVFPFVAARLGQEHIFSRGEPGDDIGPVFRGNRFARPAKSTRRQGHNQGILDWQTGAVINDQTGDAARQRGDFTEDKIDTR